MFATENNRKAIRHLHSSIKKNNFNNINIANATYGWGIYDSSADGSFQIWNRTNSTTGAVALTIKRGGNVGIGTK